MGLAEDLQSFKNNWSNISLASRCIFGLSLFLSFLSIASLADSVYKFKGFLSEAIIFWHLITTPAISFIQKVLPNIKSWQFDFIALTALTFLPYIISSWSEASKAKKYMLLISISCWPFLPFLYPKDVLMIFIVSAYVLTFVVFLIPPFTNRFSTIAIRMAFPPVVVAILGGISEGLSRPLI